MSGILLIGMGGDYMTGKEKTFFRMCIKFVLCGLWTIKEVMDMLQDSIDYDECVDYLRKWGTVRIFQFYMDCLYRLVFWKSRTVS